MAASLLCSSSTAVSLSCSSSLSFRSNLLVVAKFSSWLFEVLSFPVLLVVLSLLCDALLSSVELL